MAPKHEPTSDKEVTALRAEYQHLLEENDALRIENVQLRRQLRSKDQTIDHLELKDHARTKRMGDLHEQVYQLGVAKADLETENRNLKLDKEHFAKPSSGPAPSSSTDATKRCRNTRVSYSSACFPIRP